MKYICKEICDIDGIVICWPGDVLEIVDAVPDYGEDVLGYVDIINETTGEFFLATWIDVEEMVLEPITEVM